MKLSVIVPVYKVEAFLRECVESILGQTMQDLELILVDDGSPDGSGAICDEYAARFPEKVRALHIDNGGQGRARNFALDIAQGDYLGFVDSDDWVDPEMYEKLINAAEAEGADIAVCDVMSKFSDGSEKYISSCFQAHSLSASGSCCNKIFRRERASGLRFPEKMWYEDFFFSAVMLSRSKKTVFVNEPLYFYRVGHVSTMHNKNARKNLDILTIMDLMKKEMFTSESAEDFRFLLINHVLLDSVNRLARLDAPDRKEVTAKLRGYVRREIPSLSDCESFRAETRNRRIIMRLNYMGLEDISRMILNIKSRM